VKDLSKGAVLLVLSMRYNPYIVVVVVVAIAVEVVVVVVSRDSND